VGSKLNFEVSGESVSHSQQKSHSASRRNQLNGARKKRQISRGQLQKLLREVFAKNLVPRLPNLDDMQGERFRSKNAPEKSPGMILGKGPCPHFGEKTFEQGVECPSLAKFKKKI